MSVIQDLVTRLREQGHAMAERSFRNPDISGPMQQLSRLFVEAADALAVQEAPTSDVATLAEAETPPRDCWCPNRHHGAHMQTCWESHVDALRAEVQRLQSENAELDIARTAAESSLARVEAEKAALEAKLADCESRVSLDRRDARPYDAVLRALRQRRET